MEIIVCDIGVPIELWAFYERFEEELMSFRNFTNG